MILGCSASSRLRIASLTAMRSPRGSIGRDWHFSQRNDGKRRTFLGFEGRPRQNADQPRQDLPELMAVDHRIHHAVLLQIFRPLESLRQFLADRLLDHPWSGKADK